MSESKNVLNGRRRLSTTRNSPFVAAFNLDVAHLPGRGVTIPSSSHGLISCVELEVLVGLRRKCVADGRSP
jgi:hypothetical protein